MAFMTSAKKWHYFWHAVFVTAIVLIAICLLDFVVQIRHQASTEIYAQAEAISVNAARLLENEVNHLKNITSTAAVLLNEQTFQDDEAIVEDLKHIATNGSLIRTLFATLDGHVYTNYAGYLGYSEDNFAINGIAIDTITTPRIIQPFYSEEQNQTIFGVAAPTTMGGKKGVLISSYDVNQFQPLFKNDFSGGITQIGIVRKDGSVILGERYDNQPTAFGTNIFDELDNSLIHFTKGSVTELKDNMANGLSGLISYSLFKKTCYIAYYPTSIQDWYITVMIPESILQAQTIPLQKSGAQLAIKLILIVVIAFSIFISIRLKIEKETQNTLKEAALYDGLTHIYNRGTIEQSLTDFFEGADDHHVLHALFIMDMDVFKEINDTYGHVIGDHALITFTEHVRTVLGSDALIGRMGGDEFIALLINCPNREYIAEKAAQMTGPIPIKTLSATSFITSSIGIACFPSDGTTFAALYRQADHALYHTKRQSKGNFCFYHEE